MLVTYIELVIFLALLGLGYYLANRLYPIETFSGESKLSPEQLSDRYKHTFNISLITMIFASPILVWVSYLIINIIVVFRMEFLYDVTYLVLPSKYMLVGIATLIGTLISTLIITAFINNTILADWEDYLYYVNNQFRFNVVTGYYYFKRISFFVIIALLYLTIDWFSAFGNEEIKINTFWGIGTAKYPYKHVTQIQQVYKPNQEIENTIFKIYFKDGLVWSSNTQGYDEYTQNKQLLWHVSNLSSLPIKDVVKE